MSQVDDTSDGEFGTVIAAAAFAITSLEEEGSLKQEKSFKGLESFLTKTKSKGEDSVIKPTDSRRLSRWFSAKQEMEDGRSAGDSSMRKSATTEQRMLENSTAERKMPEKVMGTIPTVKKTPTFSDKYLNDTSSKRFETETETRPRPYAPSTIKPTASLPANGNRDGVSAGSGKVETEADAWEKAEMAKIKKRYEMTHVTILEWENEKKTKAKRRMERKEAKLEERRARVLQEYRNEIARIDKIAGGARAVADERKRNAESKVKEKAKQIRSTGKVPHKCLCF